VPAYDFADVRETLDNGAHFGNLAGTPYYDDAVYERFSEAEHRRRLDGTRAKMARLGLDGLIACGGPNHWSYGSGVFWLTHQRAWHALVRRGPDVLIAVLAAWDEANPAAANWLRAAVDAIAERAVRVGRPLPTRRLEAFITQTRYAGPARRLAYEWLTRVDPSAPGRLLPGMLQDPSTELRRDAVAVTLKEAQALADKGDRLAATLGVNHIGSSSIGVSITLCGPDGAERVRGRSVLVFIRGETKHASPIPDELRARITRFYAG